MRSIFLQDKSLMGRLLYILTEPFSNLECWKPSVDQQKIQRANDIKALIKKELTK